MRKWGNVMMNKPKLKMMSSVQSTKKSVAYLVIARPIPHHRGRFFTLTVMGRKKRKRIWAISLPDIR